MSKMIEKTVGKVKLLSLIVAVIVALGVVIAAVFGFNSSLVSADKQYLTVEMNRITFKNDKESVETLCEDKFAEFDVCYLEKIEAELSGDSAQIVYVFDKEADLTQVKAGIVSNANAENGIVVSLNEADVIGNVADGYFVRNSIACAVFAVAAIVYVSLRYKLNMGLTLGASLIASVGLTVALVAFTRIPVAYSFIYVLAAALLLTSIMNLVSFNKLRENAKADSFKDLSAEEAVASSVAVKETLILAGSLAGALVVLGGLTAAFGVWNVAWFALLSLIATVCSAAVSLIFTPALYASLKKVADKKAAERARYDYKKPAKQDKDEEQSA